MTDSERAVILAHPHARDRALVWSKKPASNRWALKAAPCPFLESSRCSIYPIRPYNCRRFGCFRPDPRREPFEPSGPFGSLNFSDRFATSRIVRRAAQALQRKARAWAVRHGWEAP
jgi:Fe-S-cluster containining protein